MSGNPSALPKSAAGGTLRASRLDDDYKALGLAVSLMMADQSFGRLPFGHWSRVLAGQIRRKHYLFAFDGKEVTGFLGWCLTDEEHAEKWLHQRGDISFDAAQDGDCVLINAWMAKTGRTNRFLLDQVRHVIKDRRFVYFKRFYKDGRMRPMKLSVNDFVSGHIEAKTRGSAAL
jgi:hemolysin-activating ACP:hemolysin acyltransferase